MTGSPRKVALIAGVTGQDGAYLAWPPSQSEVGCFHHARRLDAILAKNVEHGALETHARE
jgi:GDP-D-mannose dehydratase